MSERKSTKWQKGQTGNPSGRPPGQSEITRLRAALSVHIPEIIEKIVASAKDGDMQAARLILERVLPPVKASEQAQALQMPEGGTLTDQGRAVLSAVAAGELPPSQGAALLSAIGTLAKVTEMDELSARIAKLEEANAKP